MTLGSSLSRRITLAYAVFGIGLLASSGTAWAQQLLGTRDMRVVTAAERGDAATVLALLQQGVDANVVASDGSTALLWSVYRADLATTRALVAADADANASNRYGLTPLLQASRIGHDDIIAALLVAGADPHVAGPEGETPLPSLELGTEDMGTSIGACDGFSCLYFNAIAWRTDTAALPVEINPRVTFERMFGETGTTEQRLARLQYKTSLLDSITDEVARLQGTLGPGDRRILADYLDNVREVERQIQRVMERSDLDIEVPAAPTGIPPSYEEHLSLTYELMQLAYQGDITRVATFLTGVEASNRGNPFIGVSESHHACSHHGDEPEKMAKYTRIVTFQVQQFANFVRRLDRNPGRRRHLARSHLALFRERHE